MRLAVAAVRADLEPFHVKAQANDTDYNQNEDEEEPIHKGLLR
jgi:hypothetical protein